MVSIIIPTYNSAKTLDVCLKSIKRQSYKNIEIIIVDRFSKDNTIKIAKKYKAKIIQIDCERSKAKNIGIKISRGKYLLFLDSDMELTDNVIKKCVYLAESNPHIGGIIIPEESIGSSFWVKIRNFERKFYINTEIESARFFRKNIVLKANGFDEKIVFFEESTLPQKIEKLGYNVRIRIGEKILHHEEYFSLIRQLKKKYYYGKTMLRYREKYKEYCKKQTSIFYRSMLFLRNKNFYKKPLLGLGIVILKSLEYFSVILGFTVEYLGLILNKVLK